MQVSETMVLCGQDVRERARAMTLVVTCMLRAMDGFDRVRCVEDCDESPEQMEERVVESAAVDAKAGELSDGCV